MTREDIIKLAREAGWPHAWMDAERLERFAALVAAAKREAFPDLTYVAYQFGKEAMPQIEPYLEKLKEMQA